MKLYQREDDAGSKSVRARFTELLLTYEIANVPRDPAARKDLDEASGQTSIPVLVTDAGNAVVGASEIIAYLDKAFGGAMPDREDEMPDAGVREPLARPRVRGARESSAQDV